MSAIKNAFHNTICFQQELEELENVPENVQEVMLWMLDVIEKLEFERFVRSKPHPGLPYEDFKLILEYEPHMSKEVRATWMNLS